MAGYGAIRPSVDDNRTRHVLCVPFNITASPEASAMSRLVCIFIASNDISAGGVVFPSLSFFPVRHPPRGAKQDSSHFPPPNPVKGPSSSCSVLEEIVGTALCSGCARNLVGLPFSPSRLQFQVVPLISFRRCDEESHFVDGHLGSFVVGFCLVCAWIES
jgi:hypothetical protein